MSKEVNNDIYKGELSALIKSSSLINSSLQTTDVLNFAMKAAEEFMDGHLTHILYSLLSRLCKLMILLG